MDKRTVTMLCSPSLPLEEAVATARKLMASNSRLDLDLAELLPSRYSSSGSGLSIPAATRLLDILDHISVGCRLVQPLGHLIAHQDPQFRSKAALMLGRRIKNVGWVKRHLCDCESRVRANVIEALWSDRSPQCEEIFLDHLDDSDNRVVGNVVYGLYLRGHDRAKPAIIEMSKHLDRRFRVTAAWLIAKCCDAELTAVLQALLTDADSTVRHAAFRALARLKTNSRHSPPTPAIPPPLPV